MTPPPAERRRRRRGGWIALIIVLVLFGGAAAGGWWVWSTYEDKIREVLGWEEPVAFLSQRSLPVSIFGWEFELPIALITVICFEAWRSFPFAFLFLTARLQAVPDVLDEAARFGATVGNPTVQRTIFRGVDATSVEGASNLPYAIPNLRVIAHQPQLPVPVLWWRSVGSTHTAFAVEMFLDEVLVGAGKDPVQGRLDLLKPEDPRPRAVIEKVAEMAAALAAHRQLVAEG